MAERRKMTVEEKYEASVVFKEVEGLSGIYSTVKDKNAKPGKYYAQVHVVEYMNEKDLKVMVVDKDDYVLFANYSLKTALPSEA